MKKSAAAPLSVEELIQKKKDADAAAAKVCLPFEIERHAIAGPISFTNPCFSTLTAEVFVQSTT
jgi:hypothetical protein